MVVKRKEWKESQEEVDPERLVFLDEMGIRTDLTRLRGWADGGERLVEAVPGGRWETNTLIHAIALDGTRAAMVIDGPVDSASFAGFCEWLLAPSLLPGDIVVMDNLSSHKSIRAIEAIETVGAQVAFLPPYSPDLNPIENIFSKLKQLLRGLRPRKLRQIVSAVLKAIAQITIGDMEAVFAHCGYAET